MYCLVPDCSIGIFMPSSGPAFNSCLLSIGFQAFYDTLMEEIKIFSSDKQRCTSSLRILLRHTIASQLVIIADY